MDKEYACALLQWLAYKDSRSATSEWNLLQAAEAAAIRPDKTFDPRDRVTDPRDILDIGSSLIVLEEAEPLNTPTTAIANAVSIQSTAIVRLAHASVLDYLESTRLRRSALCSYHMSEDKAQLHLAESCLRYLLTFEESSIDLKEVSL